MAGCKRQTVGEPTRLRSRPLAEIVDPDTHARPSTVALKITCEPVEALASFHLRALGERERRGLTIAGNVLGTPIASVWHNGHF